MEPSMHIPWTRAAKLRTPPHESRERPAVDEKFLKALRDLLVETLAPFPEAREALCLALIEFDRQWPAFDPFR